MEYHFMGPVPKAIVSSVVYRWPVPGIYHVLAQGGSFTSISFVPHTWLMR